jgi:hypothetical protein
MDTTLPDQRAKNGTQFHRCGEGERLPVDLRRLLDHLGNALIENYGFSPAELHGGSSYLNRTTEPLVRFLVWLQHTPEAGAILRDMGVWPEHIGGSTSLDQKKDETSPQLAGPHWPRKKRSSVA